VVFVENVPTYHSIGHERQKAAVFFFFYSTCVNRGECVRIHVRDMDTKHPPKFQRRCNDVN